MLFGPTGWGASIKDQDSAEYTRPVEQWSETGEALAADLSDGAGRLVPATSLPGFQRLVPLYRSWPLSRQHRAGR
jgi:hypothetical protein